MKFLGEYIKNNGPDEALKSKDQDHSVIVHFVYYKEELDPLHELEDKLEEAIIAAGAGRYDGHEIAMDDSDGFLYMYGPSAEKLFKTVKPILESTDFTKGAVATLRFGSIDADALELEVEIER